MSDKTRNRLLLAALGAASALLLFLAYPPVDAGPLVLVAFVPWLVALGRLTPGKGFFFSYAVAFAFAFLSLFWLSTVTLAGLLIACLVVAFYFAVAGFCVSWVGKRAGLPLALLAPLFFTALEFVRSLGTLGFPWVLTGHALYRWRLLIQIADLGGAFLVSFLVLAFNGALADLARAARARSGVRRAGASVAASVLALVAAGVYGALRADPGEPAGPELLLVQGNIPQEIKEAGDPKGIWETHVRLTLENVRETTDIVVWPETMVPRSLFLDAEMLEGLLSLAEDLEVPVVVGTVRPGPAPGGGFGEYNCVVVVRPDGTLGDRYDKIHLVPGGEYVPLRSVFPALESMVVSWFGYLPDVEPGRSLHPLEVEGADGRRWRMGVLICYENIFPRLARGLKRRDARFLANITNEGWFKDSFEFEQILALSCFRAVETRLTVVRAANTGITAMVGPAGEVYEALEVEGKRTNVAGALSGVVRLDGRWTLYAAVGDLFAWVLLVSGAGVFLFSSFRGRKKGLKMLDRGGARG